MQCNTYPADFTHVLAVVPVPGIENIDDSYTAGPEWDEEKKCYYDVDLNGEKIKVGECPEDVIRYLADRGYLDEDIIEWLESVKEAIKEDIGWIQKNKKGNEMYRDSYEKA